MNPKRLVVETFGRNANIGSNQLTLLPALLRNLYEGKHTFSVYSYFTFPLKPSINGLQ